MKYLLSFPRSGNHLTRFFIELLSETPTLGVVNNPSDIPIYKNTFPDEVHFQIGDDFPLEERKCECFIKSHTLPPQNAEVDTLILLVRNPRECLIRQNGFYTWNQNYNWHSYEAYFQLIDYYLRFPHKKHLFFYEDMLTDKKAFVKELYDFLELDKPDKLEYVLENVDWLYEMSAKGKGRCWEEVKSNGQLVFYYPRVREKIKPQFDAFLSSQCALDKFKFIGQKYNIT